MSIAGLRRREGLGKAKLPCKKRGVQLLAAGGALARSPFPTALGCTVWYRPPLEKQMVGVEKNLLPDMLG